MIKNQFLKQFEKELTKQTHNINLIRNIILQINT